MALPAFRFLKNQLNYFIDNRCIGASVTPSARKILEFAYDLVQYSEEIARKLVLSSTSTLDLEIRVAVQKLQRKIDSLWKMHTTDSDWIIDFPREELEALKRDVLSFAGMLKKMEANNVPVAGEDDVAIAAVSSSTDAPKMVGLSDQYEQLRDRINPSKCVQYGPVVVILVGMPGIGKTTLATKAFQDPDTVARYDCRAWVTVGRKCQIKEIPRRILAAVNPDAGSDQNLDDDEIARCLRECLSDKRYLIVLDDVWNKYMAWHFVPESECNSFEPRDTFHRDGLVVITTRIHQLENDYGNFPDYVLKMRLLNNEESWDLLCEKVFGAEQACPPHLEEDGKKIAQNCEGLPLTILTVADLLSKQEKTPKFWRDVAAKKNHKLFMDAYEKISKVLYSSYQELTHVLKLCFFYMGVFPQSFEIRRSKIINMWSVDGFIEAAAHKFQYPSEIECLDELVSNSLVMIYQNSTISDASDVGGHQIKSCGLHSSLWYLSTREATKAKFCHVLSVLDDCSDDYLEGQSRLSFQNNILFGIKDVCQSVEDTCTSTTHSLLCYGLYQPYQVPICFGLNMLQELDALTIRFYEFPMEVLQLVELRYLALTLNGKLPSSVSQLSKLQFLIVDRHMSIKSYKELPMYLPMEIWDMKELKHLQVMGSDLLPDPRGCLESLSTLSNISAHSCTEGVLKAIPNLRKLRVRIESVPNDGGESTVCFDHIYHLEKLASLKCVVVNPETVPRFALSPSFPKRLRKLSLSGLCCSWGEISKIASLVYLEVLKLRNYACRGPKWELKGDHSLGTLKALVIEDTDLEEWIIGRLSLQNLQSLSVKHSYKLQRIRWEFDSEHATGHWACHNSLKKIELVDCNPSGVEQMKKALHPRKLESLIVHSSWKDQKLKT